MSRLSIRVPSQDADSRPTAPAFAGGFAGRRVGDGDGYSVNCVDGSSPLLEHQNLLDFGGASAAAGKKARMED